MVEVCGEFTVMPVAICPSTLLIRSSWLVLGRRQYICKDVSLLWFYMYIILRSVKHASLNAVIAVARRECPVQRCTPLFVLQMSGMKEENCFTLTLTGFVNATLLQWLKRAVEDESVRSRKGFIVFLEQIWHWDLHTFTFLRSLHYERLNHLDVFLFFGGFFCCVSWDIVKYSTPRWTIANFRDFSGELMMKFYTSTDEMNCQKIPYL